MKKIELILILLIIISVVLNYSLVVFGSLLTVVTFILLSFYYLIFGFALFNNFTFKDVFKRKAYQDISAMRFVGAFCFGFSLFILVTGIFFKVMVWAGSSVSILVGLMALIITAITALVRFTITKDSRFYKGIFIRFSIAFVLGITAFMISGITLLEIKFGDYPEFIDAVKAADQNPNNIELLRKKEEAYHKMINEIRGVKNQ